MHLYNSDLTSKPTLLILFSYLNYDPLLFDFYLFVMLHVPCYRCESLAELIWANRQQIKKVELLRAQLPIDIPQGQADLLPILNTTITGLLSSLVTR